MKRSDVVDRALLLGDMLAAGRVDRAARGGGAAALAGDQHDSEDDDDGPRAHEDVADQLKVDPGDADVEGKTKDCADDDKEDSQSETHSEPLSFGCQDSSSLDTRSAAVGFIYRLLSDTTESHVPSNQARSHSRRRDRP